MRGGKGIELPHLVQRFQNFRGTVVLSNSALKKDWNRLDKMMIVIMIIVMVMVFRCTYF